jgi:hypothetical protein
MSKSLLNRKCIAQPHPVPAPTAERRQRRLALAAALGSILLVGSATSAACGGVLDVSAPAPGSTNSGDSGVNQVDAGAGIVENKWAWLGPVPGAGILNAAWTAADNDVWVAGNNGTVLRWDGKETFTPSYQGPADVQYKAIWGNSVRDVWVAGDKNAMHFDGTSWSSDPTLSGLNIVSLHGNGDIVAARTFNNNVIWSRRPYRRWSSIGNPDRTSDQGQSAVWVDENAGIWVAGNGGQLSVNYFGVGTPVSIHPSNPIRSGALNPFDPNFRYLAIDGNSASDVWALFLAQITNTPDKFQLGLTHWNGTLLTAEILPKAVWVGSLAGGDEEDYPGLSVSTSKVVVGRMQLRAGVWSEFSNAPLRKYQYHGPRGTVLTAFPKSHVVAGSLGGQIEESQSLHLMDLTTGTAKQLGAAATSLGGLVVDGEGTAWASELLSPQVPAGSFVRVLVQNQGGQWKRIPLPSPVAGARYQSLAQIGSVGGRIWIAEDVADSATNYSRVSVFDILGWSDASRGLPTNSLVKRIVGAATKDAPAFAFVSALSHFGGNPPPTIYQWDGTWKALSDSENCDNVNASPTLGVTAICDGMLVTWNRQLRSVLAPRYPLAADGRSTDVLAWSTDSIWADGSYYNGANWAERASGAVSPVGGSAANNMWFSRIGTRNYQDVSRESSLLHWNGSTLTTERVLNAVSGSAAYGGGVLWYVGAAGRTLRYGPTATKPTPRSLPRPLSMPTTVEALRCTPSSLPR